MSETVACSRLAVYEYAVEAAGLAIRLAAKAPPPLKPIADQLVRSAASVPANLAEGHGRTGRDRSHLWRIAYGSAKEVDSPLRLLLAAGAVNRAKAEVALKVFVQVRAMTRRLLHPKR